MSSILVVGHKGMLGRVVHERLNAQGLDLPEFDITDKYAVLKTIEEISPSAIINCAAYTQVDQAESEEELATKVNGKGVKNLAEAAKQVGAYFLTISTDYVFDGEGTQPYREDHRTAPQSAYGRSKLAGELAVQGVGGQWAIARTQWLYGEGGKNFIDTIAALAAEKDQLQVVDDQVGAPTWTSDLAYMLIGMLEKRAKGIYHTACSGYCSWFDVACYVVKHLGLNCKVEPCGSDKYPRPAKRPHNSRLSLSKITKTLGGPPRHWQQALAEYLESQS